LRASAGFFVEVIQGMSAMTDQRQKREPKPHLQTRPATMITAIGLCVIIMLIQLVPQIQDAATRLQTTTISSAR
jgi:hypothetical protein